jgi:beta-galactosidase
MTASHAPVAPSVLPALNAVPAKRVTAFREGLRLGETVLPLYAGAMHYFRHAPEEWAAGLDAMVAMGLKLVDIYVPWGVHETRPEHFDFGEVHPWLDVAQFVRMAGERGLYVIVRPGPHINAELTYFGLPERVVWNSDCQARTPKGNPVMLPMVPLGFPVPSYASDAFHDETARWFEAVGNVLAPLRYPDGPIVMVQIDNEGALYFRDGAYDQDYHPDAIRQFREYLRAKYHHIRDLRTAWNQDQLQFATVEAPTKFDAVEATQLARHMDWVEFHEVMLANAFARFTVALEDAGLSGLATMHNLPMGEAATPLNPARMRGAIDVVALDYYHHATPEGHAVIARRTTELVCRTEGTNTPAFGAEIGAGFPPFFAPMDEKDSLYTLLGAMAYGLRGFNLYMAVDRDRWVGAPIDVHGTPRPFADSYRAILRALDRTQFHTLRRRAEVRLVMPRSLRRLARAAHAFGPITPTAFHISGAGYGQSMLEGDLGLGETAPLVAQQYLEAFERALDERGIPYGFVGGEGLAESISGAKWVISALAGGVKREFVEDLRKAAQAGIRVTVGPRIPTRDGSMREMDAPHDISGLELLTLDDFAQVQALVGRRVDELQLRGHTASPPSVKVTLHEDAQGAARVLFVMNPTPVLQTTFLALREPHELCDAIDESAPRIAREGGGFTVQMPARSVRIFEIK